MCYPGLAGGTFRAGQRLDSEHCTNFCDYNGLGCLPVANGTTGAQRFLAAQSNQVRARFFLPPTPHERAFVSSWGAGLFTSHAHGD
jgi:hypothetical protein